MCCSQLRDSRAAVSYQVTDLSAFHAPLFVISTKLHTLRTLSDEAAEGRVRYGTTRHAGAPAFRVFERAEQREKVDSPVVIQSDSDVVLVCL